MQQQFKMEEHMGADDVSAKYSLRVKLKRPSEEKLDHVPHKRSQTNNYKEWRKRLKKDQGRYEEYKKKDAAVKRTYRQSLMGEQLKKSNEQTKMRMRAYRQRKKDKGVAPKMSTRKQIDKRREYWRTKKREQREKMSGQAKRREKEKRRERRALKKNLSEGTPSKETSRKNSRSGLPKTPENFAAKIEKEIQQATPRKKNALQKRGLLISPESKTKNETNAKIVARVKQSLNELKRQRTKEGRNRYRFLTRSIVGKYAVEHRLRKALNLKWEHWTKMSEIERNGTEAIKRSDAMPDETIKNIETFYESESVTLPTKRTVSNKTMKQKRVLTETLHQVHKRFLRENPALKVSLSHFRKLRPKEVLTVQQQRFYSCLCEYCLNVQFKIEGINQALKSHDISTTIDDKYHAIELSLCEKEKDVQFHQLKCYERECDDCGTNQLWKYLECLVVADNGKGTYIWKRWELGIVGGTSKKEIKRQLLAEHTGTLNDLISEFVREVEFLANHLFIAKWQYHQFNKLTKSVPANWLVTIADFSENYRCINQDEIQSAYYGYSQVTVFPVIAYYRCPDCEDAIVQESVVVISSDLNHDAAAADLFAKKVTEHVHGHVTTSHEVQFTDGCASQFKSKLPFLQVSQRTGMERAYFGSRHGKGPCDALGGIVKKQAEMHVKSRKGTIQTAKALFEFCEENLTIHGSKCEHKRRMFLYQEGIERDEKKQGLQTLKGTRTVHSVRGVEPGTVEVRHLSCFCKACISQDAESEACCSEHYVGEWKSHEIAKHKLLNVATDKKKQKTNGRKKKDKEKRRENDVTGVEQKGKEKGRGDSEVEESRKGKGNDENIGDQNRKRGERSNSKTEETTLLDKCSSMKQLKQKVKNMTFETLPVWEQKSFCHTGKTIDKNSIKLVPKDIPLATEELFPSEIYGDGNCLPRSASLLAYSTEDNHKKMRERIVCELVQNEKSYLNNRYMKRGKNELGDANVVKTFAAYSSVWNGSGKLDEQDIKKLFEKEVLDICKTGKYMGLWQLASLANILSCPVVSVCPTYGMHTVRKDMHRVFYPFKEQDCVRDPAFIMWTNINGSNVPEKEFSVNHFVVLMPLNNSESVNSDMDMSLGLDISEDAEDVLLSDSILDIINSLEMSDTVTEGSVQTSKPETHESHSETGATPETTEVNLDTTKANPEATNANQETTEVYLDNTEATSETTEPNPETTEVKLETSQANPEATNVNPETAEANPEITEANPETTEANTETTEANQKTSEVNLETTEANKETAEANSETTEANPETTEANPETTKVNPETTYTDNLESTNPETTESNPETTEAILETSEAKPETAEANSETTEANPETTEANPEAAEANSETAEALSETTEANPETTEANPETTEVNPETSYTDNLESTNPETTESNPETTEAILETSEVKPETAEANSETTEANPETTEANSETTEANPETTEVNPENTYTDNLESTNPETTEYNPETTEAILETSEVKPETAEANSETTEANPETTQANTEAAEANSETAEAISETTEANPETTEANPETTEVNPETSYTDNLESTNTETPESNPETTEANPETTEANPETTEANPETTEVNPETAEANSETAEANSETTEANPETTEVNPENTYTDNLESTNPETPESNPSNPSELNITARLYKLLRTCRIQVMDCGSSFSDQQGRASLAWKRNLSFFAGMISIRSSTIL